MLACLFAVTYLLSLFSSFVSNSCAARFKYLDLENGSMMPRISTSFFTWI